MSKPTLEQVAYATYVLGVNFNGRCVYCGKNMSGMPPDYKKWHYEQEHIEPSDSPAPQAETGGADV